MRRNKVSTDGLEASIIRALENSIGAEDVEVMDYEFYDDIGGLCFKSSGANNEESEWLVADDEDQAEEMAIALVTDDLENEPALFDRKWLSQYIYISDTDKNILIEEERESLEGDVPEDDMTSMLDSYEQGLEDPVQYFVNDTGIFSFEDLIEASFIQIDISLASQGAVDTDGVAHFLDKYDGVEEYIEDPETGDTYIAYGLS